MSHSLLAFKEPTGEDGVGREQNHPVLDLADVVYDRIDTGKLDQHNVSRMTIRDLSLKISLKKRYFAAHLH
jgi:hypothetical protein